ncbi:SagB/ThcOx family dehydrogenase (plasmid) [Streptomyces sp. NBC_01281]|uniref:SagB/ThcOx family dehydrogenase n=1 Tax=Streptomyces sp. NBC_01281 TaxID=2903811 RepID=UPI002E155585|nr:SagB/ThcOx family dehydrogenase [Streptomyces sp. NBC_01281]
MLKAVDPLFIQHTQSGLYATSPRVPVRLKVGEKAAHLLLALREPADVEEISIPGAAPDGVREMAAQLTKAGFLVQDTDSDQYPAAWSQWGTVAWLFHEQIRDAPFVNIDSSDADEYKQDLSQRTRPSSFKDHGDAPVLLLPRVWSRLDISLKDVLEGRRTHRKFTGQPVTLDDFSTILHYGFAPLRFANAGQMGVLPLRANASGGSRHETEAYVAVINVEGIDPGLYLYDGIRHALILINPDTDGAVLDHLTYEQGFFGDSAAFGIITSAVVERMTWKYPHPRAYKLMMHNVGTVIQNFSMITWALGLGAAITGGFRDTETEQELKLDPMKEFPTFFMSCGVPERADNGMPVSYRTARTAPDSY